MTEFTTKADMSPTQTDWNRLRTTTDEELTRAVPDDSEAAPIPTPKELQQYKPAPARNKR